MFDQEFCCKTECKVGLFIVTVLAIAPVVGLEKNTTLKFQLTVVAPRAVEIDKN